VTSIMSLMYMYKAKIISTNFINYNVKRFIIEKPEGLTYRPGETAHISLNLPGWEDKVRSFTFTSLNNWPFLEFIIKIYDDHEGVTHALGKLNAGAELLIHDVFGSLEYRGPGIFIAGGTGITPFIAIFRALFLTQNLRNAGLIYSNHSKEDVILHDELSRMLGPAYMNVFTRQGVIGFKERKIDRDFLIQAISDFSHYFYICGPSSFTKDITENLISLGARTSSLII
jgi:ferredoxin-NADP reductase